jgi:hypothetical protein
MGLCTRAFGFIVVVATALLMAGSGLTQEGSKHPVESMSVSVPEESREEFLGALTRFAQLNKMEVDTIATTPTGRDYRAWLANTDVEIVAVNPFDPTVFFIFFYYGKSGRNSDDNIRMARSALASMLTSTAGVTITNDP